MRGKMQKAIGDYIDEIGKLPKPLDFILESENEQWIFNNCRITNYKLSLWLRNKILGEPLNPLALEDNGYSLMPKAEYLEAVFKLCIEIYNRYPIYSSPAEFWFLVIANEFNELPHFLGLSGQPALRSKREMADKNSKIISIFNDLSINPTALLKPKFLEGRLYFIGHRIAVNDPHFDRKIWRPFIKAWSHANRYFRDSTDIHLLYLLSDGQIVSTSGRGRLPKSNPKEPSNVTKYYKKRINSPERQGA